MASSFKSWNFNYRRKAEIPPSSYKDETATAAEPKESHAKPKIAKLLPVIWELLRPFRWLLFGSLLLMVVNRLCSFAIPISSRYLINDVMYKHELRKLPLIIGAVIVATFLQGITTYVLFQRISVAGQQVIAELRMRLQRHIVHLPISFYDNNRTGTIVARIMTDVEGVRNIVGAGLLDFAGGVLTATIALVVLVHISVRMTLLTCGIFLIFGLFLKKTFAVLRPIAVEKSRINAEVTGRLTESVGGVRVVKGYCAEEHEARVFAEGARRILNNMAKSVDAQSFLSFCSIMILGFTAALIMYLGGRDVAQQRLDIGGYVEFILLLAFIIAPIAMLVSVGTQLTEAFAGLDRTMEILNELPEDVEPARTKECGRIIGNIEFKKVTFAYEAPSDPVLQNISFEAKPGTITALVGSSGSGKSTIISLICGFHSAVKGQVLIDGVDLDAMRLSSFRQQLGVVLQETFLFDGTIRENVLFSRPRAPEEQLVHACRIARVDEFAERFPAQYETIVGERGVKLSGGQRQRVSIARAILADPRILILDEATSSLDSESETLIQQGLSYLMQGRTTIVIAHRLSTIRRADQILVIEQGRVLERGNHESLYRLGGRYYELYIKQHGLDTDLFLAPGEGDKIV